MCSQAKSSGTKLLEVHGVQKELRSKLETRKATYNIQTRQDGEAASRSRKSWIEKKKA